MTISFENRFGTWEVFGREISSMQYWSPVIFLIRNTCNTSPVIGVIRAYVYTSIREVLLEVLRDGSKEGVHNSKTLIKLRLGGLKLVN